jgi:ribonuclease P protein subunit RPR2
MNRKKPEAWTRLARERMQILLSLAEDEAHAHPERSKRYVELAKRIGMRYNVRMKGTKRFCRKCSSLLVPGVTCRIRARKGRQAVVTTCLKCGAISRRPYIREKKIIKQRRTA